MLLHLKSSYKAYDSLNSLNIVSGDFPDNGNTSVCWYPMHKVEKWSTVVWVFTKFMASLPKVCQKTNPVQRHVECCTECGICTMYELYKSLTDNPMLKLHGYTQGYTCAMHILRTHFACGWYNKCAQHIRPSWVDIVFISCTTCITCTKICCNGSCNGCTKTCCNGCTRSLGRNQWVGMLAF